MSRALRRRPGLRRIAERRVAQREELRELRRERARAAAGVTPAMVQDLDPATRAYVEELERRNDSR